MIVRLRRPSSPAPRQPASRESRAEAARHAPGTRPDTGNQRGRSYFRLAGRRLRRTRGCRHPPGLLRARCRPQPADPALPGQPGDAYGLADHRGRGRRDGAGRVARRRSPRAADAVIRGRQHDQHARGTDRDAGAPADARDDARRVGRVQSLATADGAGYPHGARERRHAGLPGRPAGGDRADRGCSRDDGLQHRPRGGRADRPAGHRREELEGKVPVVCVRAADGVVDDRKPARAARRRYGHGETSGAQDGHPGATSSDQGGVVGE